MAVCASSAAMRASRSEICAVSAATMDCACDRLISILVATILEKRPRQLI